MISVRASRGRVISFIRMTALNPPRRRSLILAVGLIYLWEAPERLEAARDSGALFVANFAVSHVSAVGMLRGSKTWGFDARVAGLPGPAYGPTTEVARDALADV